METAVLLYLTGKNFKDWLDKGAGKKWFYSPESKIEKRESKIENRESRIEKRESKIENRESRIENQKSRSENQTIENRE